MIMGEKEQKQEQPPKTNWQGLRKVLRKIRAGKFFPRRFFVNNWSLLLTLSVLFLASIAHRNMYMIQLNKIEKLVDELANRRTDCMLLQEEYDRQIRPDQIAGKVAEFGLPLYPASEAQEEIVLRK